MGGSGAAQAWKLGSLELTCRTRLAGTVMSAGCNPGALTECFALGLAAVNRSWAATERFEGKEILKIMVSGAAKFIKWWCSGADLFFVFWLLICENDMLCMERKFRAENGGIKSGTYPICTWKCLPPPPRPLWPGSRARLSALFYNSSRLLDALSKHLSIILTHSDTNLDLKNHSQLKCRGGARLLRPPPPLPLNPPLKVRACNFSLWFFVITRITCGHI